MNPKVWLLMLLIGALVMAVNLISRKPTVSGDLMQNS